MATAVRRPPSASVADVALADVLARVARLEAIVADLQPRRARVEAPAGLLSAIAATVGRAAFSSRDLVRQPDRELAAVLDGAGAHQVGVWLRRLHRHPTPPYVLSRVTRDGAGMVWTLSVDADRHTPPRVSARHGG